MHHLSVRGRITHAACRTSAVGRPEKPTGDVRMAGCIVPDDQGVSATATIKQQQFHNTAGLSQNSAQIFDVRDLDGTGMKRKGERELQR